MLGHVMSRQEFGYLTAILALFFRNRSAKKKEENMTIKLEILYHEL